MILFVYGGLGTNKGGIMQLKNGKDLLIRKARKDDAAELIKYLNTVGGESDNLLYGADEFTMSVEQEEEYIDNLSDSDTSVLLVGTVDDKIVCVGSIFAPTRERIAHQGDLGMSVLKEFWGLGVGTCLMEALIQFAEDTNKIEILHLQVRTDNTHAIALYKKMGFEEIGVYSKYTKIDGQYFDDILMNLYL